jgi:uncharacterized protein with FMN-binding domain
MSVAHRGGWWRPGIMQAGRVLLLAGIVAAVHVRHRERMSEQHAQSLSNIPLRQLRQVFPEVISLGDAESHGGRVVLGPNHEPLGYLIQTAPESDRFIGFSGSTNLAVGFTNEDRIRGLVILKSDDTRDHVDLIERQGRFLESFAGKTWPEAAGLEVDAVSGATLTSLSMLEGLRARLGNTGRSLKFPERPTLGDAKTLFAAAARVTPEPDDVSLWRVFDKSGTWLGNVFRTSPAADNVIGYQGPTEVFLGIGKDGRITGMLPGRSYDNEPYVDYVRQDEYFRNLFNGKTTADLAAMNLKAAQVEGVSGATMTSMAIARGMVKAAQARESRKSPGDRPLRPLSGLRWREIATILFVIAAAAIGLTGLRGIRWARTVFQVASIGYLGLVNGEMLSQAMLAGWARHGIPWQNALGLIVMTAAAFLLPVATGANIYCHQLCPHGAAQQLLKRGVKYRWKVPAWFGRALILLRPALLLWVLLVSLCDWPFSLVDIEPFDAYLWRSAGWATLAVAAAGLAASAFVPMAYCRYGCPTGGVIDYLRTHRMSGRVRWSDAMALACLLLGVFLLWAG